jgi:hypothetical protein
MPPSDHLQPPPPPNRPDPYRDEAGPYAQRPIDERGEGEGRSLLFAAIATAAQAVLLGATIVGTMIVGARCEKVFREFNMKVDDLTHFALGVSRWLNNYWYVLVLFLVPLLLVDGGILYALHRSRPSRRWSYFWAAVVLFLILAFAGCMSAVLYGPYSKLVEGLSR